MTFGERASELAGFAAGLLGWRPAEFWSSTPAELEAAFGRGEAASEPVDRRTIERLIEQFPDNRGR